MSEPGIVIGDVHGCIKTLEALVSKLPKGRSIYLTGDLIDRGPNSADVIDYVMAEGLLPVLGNHDHLMLVANKTIKLSPYCHNAKELWFDPRNGGQKTVDSYKGDEDRLKKHLKYLKSLPYYLTFSIPKTLGGYTTALLTHSGVCHTLEKDMENIKAKPRLSSSPISESFLWNRETPAKVPDMYSIFGHTPIKKPLITKHYVSIDGGCVFGNKLFAIDMSDFKVFEQKLID